MKAILNASGFSPDLMPLVRYRPTCLFRIVDKPIIVHIIEFLVHHGITKIELILSHLPEQIEDVLEEGSRWGVKITYHLAREPQYPFAVLSPVARGWKDALVLFGRADLLPDFDPQKLRAAGHTKPVLLYTADHRWTGWGLIPPALLATTSPVAPFETLPAHIGEHYQQFTKEPLMEALTFGGWQHTNNALISQRASSAAFPSSSRMVEPGIWLSRATAIHPTVTLTPPVFVGDNCQILEGASIGPNTIIENHCIIDRQSVVENSIVCQQSYVGRSLEIRDSIVDRDTLINLSFETAVTISDDFILAHLTTPSVSHQLFGFFERFAALFILLVMSPFVIPMTLFWSISSAKVVRLPVLKEHDPWPTFQLYSFERPEGWLSSKLWKFFQRLPGLVNIARGEMHFVGIHPISVSQLERLLPDWQALYRKTKVGLITLADVDYPDLPSDSERFASETYYATHQRVRFDLHVLMRWIVIKMKHLFGGDG